MIPDPDLTRHRIDEIPEPGLWVGAYCGDETYHCWTCDDPNVARQMWLDPGESWLRLDDPYYVGLFGLASVVDIRSGIGIGAGEELVATGIEPLASELVEEDWYPEPGHSPDRYTPGYAPLPVIIKTAASYLALTDRLAAELGWDPLEPGAVFRWTRDDDMIWTLRLVGPVGQWIRSYRCTPTQGLGWHQGLQRAIEYVVDEVRAGKPLQPPAEPA